MTRKRILPDGNKVVYIVVLSIFVLYAISLVYPLIWVFTNSFRTKQNFFLYPLRSIFKELDSISLKNYVNAFESYSIGTMFFNSILISFGATFFTMLVSAMSAYVVSKYDFAFKHVIYVVSIFIMIIPTTGSIATTYKLMNDLGLAGHRYGLIVLAASGFGFNFFMIYSAFANLSWSYAESAMIDGAGHIKIFFSIMLPLIKPVLFSVGLIAFIGLWNDYYSPYMYMRENPTLAVGIYLMSFNITNGENAYDYPGLFALMMLATIPIIIVFSIFQKTIMANTVAGGLKG